MDSPVRIDKWLWAARFFKTRSMARAAVQGGKVRLNDSRAKPAKTLEIGDELRIQRGEETWVIHVRELSDRRGPASEAQKLYEETEQSRSMREALDARRKAEAQGGIYQSIPIEPAFEVFLDMLAETFAGTEPDVPMRAAAVLDSLVTPWPGAVIVGGLLVAAAHQGGVGAGKQRKVLVGPLRRPPRGPRPG